MFKIFPGTFTHDGRKVSIKECKWKAEATTDKTIIDNWSQLYSQKIKFWGVPTGAENGLLVLDVDLKKDENGFETIKNKNYHIPITRSQKTLSGGMHYIFKYPTDGNYYANRQKFDHGLDIRGEGGYIVYYGMDDSPIADAPDWLLEQALSTKDLDREVDLNSMVKVAPEIVNSIVTEACENVRNAPDGESNNILNIEAYRLGQLVTSNSLDKLVAFNSLFEAAKSRGKNDYEATATINSGIEGGFKNPIVSPFGNEAPVLTIPETKLEEPTRWTPSFFSKYDLTNISNLRRPQVFKDWSTEDIHITTADGGTGKTTLKLFEAICLALGESFLGFECKEPGRTLFITGEDTAGKLGAMIGAIMKQMKIMDDDVKVATVLNSILVKKDSDLCLISKGKDGFIKVNSEAVTKLLEAIEDLRPKMIVFDPISSFWGSEAALNDMAKAVSKFTGLLVEKSNACVEIINHMGKASSGNKDMGQFAGRGGTGLPSHARVSRVLRPVLSDEYTELTGMELEDEKSAMMCNVNKFSDGSPLYNNPFLIVREGYLFSRVTLQERKIKEEQSKMTDEQRIFTFIRGERNENRYPTKNIIIAHFMAASDKLSKDRIIRGISYIEYAGHMGEKIKLIDNPHDAESRERVFITLDQEGKEI